MFRQYSLLYYETLKITVNIIKSTTRSAAVDVTYKIHGSQPSENNKHIIVLHGLLGSKRNWDTLSKNIASANNACVITADARNHGDSPHSSSHTYHDLASDAAQLMNKLSIKKAHFIGHSMGGRTAMTLALTQPSKIASLVAVDISPAPTGTNTHDFFKIFLSGMRSVNFQGADTLAKAKQAAKDQFLASGLVDDVDGLGFILMNIGKVGDKSYGWKCNVDAFLKNISNISSFPTELTGKQYTGPTLFIGGGDSTYIPKSHKTKIKEFFPKAELKYIEDVGHNVHAENPTAFLKLVNDFYSKHL